MATAYQELVPLSFGTLRKIDDHLAEVIVDEGVTLDMPAVDEYHECLRSRLRPPIAVLVNKKHQYTYSFEAMQCLGTIPEICAAAVYAPNHHAECSVGVVLAMQDIHGVTDASPEKGRPVRLFSDRSQAEGWLRIRIHTELVNRAKQRLESPGGDSATTD